MRKKQIPAVNDSFDKDIKDIKHSWPPEQKRKVILRVIILAALLIFIISLNVFYRK